MLKLKERKKKLKRFFASFPSLRKMLKIIQPNQIDWKIHCFGVVVVVKMGIVTIKRTKIKHITTREIEKGNKNMCKLKGTNRRVRPNIVKFSTKMTIKHFILLTEPESRGISSVNETKKPSSSMENKSLSFEFETKKNHSQIYSLYKYATTTRTKKKTAVAWQKKAIKSNCYFLHHTIKMFKKMSHLLLKFTVWTMLCVHNLRHQQFYLIWLFFFFFFALVSLWLRPHIKWKIQIKSNIFTIDSDFL